jgi:hypothetical protein
VQAASTQKIGRAARDAIGSPTFVYKLEPLNERNAHREAIRQAATWMKRPRDSDGNFAATLRALHALSGCHETCGDARGYSRCRYQPVPPPTGQLPVRAQDGALDMPAIGDEAAAN